MNLKYTDFNFEHLLIKRYLNYSLNEIDLLVILKSKALIDEGINIITCNMLVPYMSDNIKKEEIDFSISKLYKKGIFKIIENEKGTFISLDEFEKKVIEDAIKDYYLSLTTVSNTDSNFYVDIEKLIKRSLSPFEREYITKWLKSGLLEKDILDAISNAISNNKVFKINNVEKILLEDKKEHDKDIDEDFNSSGWMNLNDEK